VSDSPEYEAAESGCWLWLGYRDRNGYARIYDRDAITGTKVAWAHRVYYARAKGPIPEGHEIDHTCSTPACVNPDHLDAVTKAEHCRRTWQRRGSDELQKTAAYMRSDGWRYRDIAEALELSGATRAHQLVQRAIDKGLVDPDSVPRARYVTDQDRDDIRDLYALGITQTDIAEWYEIHSSQVSRICAGLTSGHSRKAS
jgi:hypothetical protein